MTDFNAAWLLIGLLVGCAAGMGGVVSLLALGSIGRGRAARRVRTRSCIKAWSGLLPDWRPDADQFAALDAESPRVIRAYRTIAEGWDRNDGRWDVLLAVLIHTRREALRVRVDEIKATAADAPPARMVREQPPAEHV